MKPLCSPSPQLKTSLQEMVYFSAPRPDNPREPGLAKLLDEDRVGEGKAVLGRDALTNNEIINLNLLERRDCRREGSKFFLYTEGQEKEAHGKRRGIFLMGAHA